LSIFWKASLSNCQHAAWPTVILSFMETRWKTLALLTRNLI